MQRFVQSACARLNAPLEPARGHAWRLLPQHLPLLLQVLRVPLDEFKALMLSGDMLLPSITTAYLALDALKDKGLL